MNSHVLRIPSAEPYGYTETMFEGTAEEAITEQKRLARIARGGGAGLPEKKYCEIIDKMIAREKIQEDPSILEEMNEIQTSAFNVIRKSLGRLHYRNR